MICNVNYVKKIAMPLPESTETRRNLRHSEQSERGGKVPEGLRLIQVGITVNIQPIFLDLHKNYRKV